MKGQPLSELLEEEQQEAHAAMLKAMRDLNEFLDQMLIGCSKCWLPDDVQTETNYANLKLDMLKITCEVMWDQRQQKWVNIYHEGKVRMHDDPDRDLDEEFKRLNEEIRRAVKMIERFPKSNRKPLQE